MASGIVFDDGVRFYDAIRVRMPSSLRDQIRAAADREGLNPAEWTRRTLVEKAMPKTACTAECSPVQHWCRHSTRGADRHGPAHS